MKRAIELLAGKEKKNGFERLEDIVKLIISILMGVAFNAALILLLPDSPVTAQNVSFHIMRSIERAPPLPLLLLLQ